jgi:hypothetical protein
MIVLLLLFLLVIGYLSPPGFHSFGNAMISIDHKYQMDEFNKLIKEIEDTFEARFFDDDPPSIIEAYRLRDFLKRLAKFEFPPPSK